MRIITFIGVMVIITIGAVRLSGLLGDKLRGLESIGIYLSYGIPTLLVIAAGLFMFWMVNRQNTADFLIATESEMKKVSWSSRKEVIGSTKVVIITTFMFAIILFVVDLIFQIFFQWAGVMPAPPK